MDAAEIALTVTFAVVGALVGWLYFLLMRRSLTHLGKGKAGMGRFVALLLLRVVLFGGGLLGALYSGNWCLISYMIGFILARTIAVNRLGPSVAPPVSEQGEQTQS